MGVVRGIGEIAEANPHVADDRTWDGNGDGHAEDCVRNDERVQIAITQKVKAGHQPPDDGDYGQDRIRQVGQ